MVVNPTFCYVLFLLAPPTISAVLSKNNTSLTVDTNHHLQHHHSLSSSLRFRSNVKRKRTESSSPRTLSIEDYGAIPDDPDSMHVHLNCLKRLENYDDMSAYHCEDDYVLFENEDDTTTALRKRRSLTTSSINTTQLALNNTIAFTKALQDIQSGDTVVVPDNKSYTLFGGVFAENKSNFILDIQGSIHFIHERDVWPKHVSPSTFFGHTYQPGISIVNCTNITLTCTSTTRAKVQVDMKRYHVNLVDSDVYHGGIINGNGKKWWDDVIAGRIHEHIVTRPRLVHIIESENVLVERLTLINSPYWTLTVEAVNAEIKFVNVIVDREVQGQLFEKYYKKLATHNDNKNRNDTIPISTKRQRRMMEYTSTRSDVNFPFPIDDLPDWVGRKMRQPQDLNTDGIDPYGTNIWIHDCIIQNADDSIAVKPSKHGRNTTRIPDCTTNITMSNLVLTGFGASVGSVGPDKHHNCVDSIKFINISMPGTAKGIYIKSNGADCINQSSQITNILYDHIDIIEPFWWALWIGPQQQHQPGDKIGSNCPLFWPLPGSKICPTEGCTQFENITLRNINIFHPLISPGVIWGNISNPMKNVVIENLHVDENKYKVWHGKWPFHDKHYPWHGRIKCIHATGTYKNSNPGPACLTPAED